MNIADRKHTLVKPHMFWFSIAAKNYVHPGSFHILIKSIPLNKIFKPAYPLVLILLFQLFVSCDIITDPAESSGKAQLPLHINWKYDQSVVCFGTSITNGKSPGGGIIIIPAPPPPPDSSYPKLLSDKLRIKVENKGNWGARVSDAYLYFSESILPLDPVLIFLEFGANEFLQNKPASETEVQLDSLITLIKSYNIQIVFLSFYNPDMLKHTPPDHYLTTKIDLANEYFEMFQRLAVKHNIPLHDYLFKNIWGREEMMSPDNIHPNNRGNAVLCDNIFNSYYYTFLASGMIK